MSAQRESCSGLLRLNEPLKRDPSVPESKKPTDAAAFNRPRLRVLRRNLRRTPNIDRVCRHLSCDLIQFRSAGDPARFFLGRGFNKSDDTVGDRATPRFRTLESLEYFCRAHLDRFLALNAFPRRPRDWFWNNT